ncbi:kelch domain-containing protein 3-like [Amblyomma americanum]
MWTVRLHGVPKRDTQRVVTINGKLYSFHSSLATRNHNLQNRVDVFIFDTASYRWHTVQTQLPDGEPTDISSHTVTAYGHCAYLWGGRCISARSHVYRFDTNTLTWSRPQVFGEQPPSLYGKAACAVGNRMHIVGTWNRRLDMWFLDLDTMEWHRVPTSGQAPACFFFTASAIGTRIYVWGGVQIQENHSLGGRVCDNSLYYLETATSTWVRPRVQGTAPVGRKGHAAFAYKEELCVFGGRSVQQGTYFADMHKYEPETSCWTEVRPFGSGPSARCFPGCSTTGERVFAFGGYGPVLNQENGEETEWLANLHVLHLAPTLENLCLLAVIDARLDVSDLPTFMRKKISDITSHQP